MTNYIAHAAVCVVLFRYVRPLAELDAQMTAHVAWLEEHFAAGRFLMSGRQEPRTGGVIVALGTREEVDGVIATGPFVTSGVVEYEIVPFFTGLMADAVRAALPWE